LFVIEIKSSVLAPSGTGNVTTFNTTFKMSTYLAAWAVVPDDFGYEELFSEKDNKPVI
jgi:hypothetical protein